MAEDIIKTEEITEAPKKKTTRKKAEPKLVMVKVLRTYISKEGKEIRDGKILDLEKDRADKLAARNIVEILK